jgi:hypothetical protein
MKAKFDVQRVAGARAIGASVAGVARAATLRSWGLEETIDA